MARLLIGADSACASDDKYFVKDFLNYLHASGVHLIVLEPRQVIERQIVNGLQTLVLSV